MRRYAIICFFVLCFKVYGVGLVETPEKDDDFDAQVCVPVDMQHRAAFDEARARVQEIFNQDEQFRKLHFSTINVGKLAQYKAEFASCGNLVTYSLSEVAAHVLEDREQTPEDEHVVIFIGPDSLYTLTPLDGRMQWVDLHYAQETLLSALRDVGVRVEYVATYEALKDVVSCLSLSEERKRVFCVDSQAYNSHQRLRHYLSRVAGFVDVFQHNESDFYHQRRAYQDAREKGELYRGRPIE